MLRSSIPLQPKVPNGPLRVLIIGRISTPQQNEQNIDASYRFVEDYLGKLYAGPIQIKHLGERASGMLAGRATIREAEDLIATGDWDLVVAEDLSRIFRNPRHQYNFVQDAVDADTRVICIGDNLDTADENWEIMLGAATLRHGTAIPDIRRRVRRTATHAFHGGGMVLKVKFGFRKLTAEEARSGQFGPPGLRLAKRTELTPVIREMRERVLRGEHYEAIADWLAKERVEVPPYARRWTARLVKELLEDPILSGTRTFRKTIHRPVFRTGKHRRLNNGEPEQQHCPELAHLTREEHQILIEAITARERDRRRVSGRAHPLYGRPRSRAIWPAQHARCAICGGLMYCFGTFLQCRNARGRGDQACWNHVQVPCRMARERIVPWVVNSLHQMPGFRDALLDAASSELTRLREHSDRGDAALAREIASLERQAANLAEAVARGGQLDPLLEQLRDTTDALDVAREKARRVESDCRSEPRLSRSALDERLDHAIARVAETSFEFADLMRRIIPSFLVQPVQALDAPLVRPRAKLAINVHPPEATIGSVAHTAQVSIDLFHPPAHVRWLQPCLALRREDPRRTLRAIAAELQINYMTAKRALDYARRLDRHGAEPYIELRDRPERASRWK